MHFMNEPDIDHAARHYTNHPILGKATKLLKAFKDKVNANSDGWPYWAPPVKAADKLMTLIENPATATEEAYKKALTPIKSFCTKRDWAFPGAPEPAKPVFTEPPPVPLEQRKKNLAGLRAKWDEIAQGLLLNRTIVAVHYMTADECRELGLTCSAVRLKLDDGLEVDVMRDDEGNGPGALHCFNPTTGAQEILPVVTVDLS